MEIKKNDKIERKEMVARLIVSEVYNLGLEDYATMTDYEVYSFYCAMISLMMVKGRPLPKSWLD